MKRTCRSITFVIALLSKYAPLEGAMLHLSNVQSHWQQTDLQPFDELILSWNGSRPIQGHYLFYIRAYTDSWSPWLLYATWGSSGQSSFLNEAKDHKLRVYQDALEVMEGHKATGFEIKIVTEQEACLQNIHHLHVYTNSDRIKEPQAHSHTYVSPVHLEVGGLSQMVLDHKRCQDLCSPTSVTAVSRYLSKNQTLNPVNLAQNAWDSGFDIFGNWAFNVAESANQLGSDWSVWVQRLTSFDQIYHNLHQKTPVIVSIRGPLKGGALAYAKGHLLAVIGYDPQDKKVICMDPAFPTDQQTHVRYNLSDFMEAWNRRGNIAYVFNKNSTDL